MINDDGRRRPRSVGPRLYRWRMEKFSSSTDNTDAAGSDAAPSSHTTGGRSVRVLEEVWAEIRFRHPDLPPVAVVVGSGSAGNSSLRFGQIRARSLASPRQPRRRAVHRRRGIRHRTPLCAGHDAPPRRARNRLRARSHRCQPRWRLPQQPFPQHCRTARTDCHPSPNPGMVRNHRARAHPQRLQCAAGAARRRDRTTPPHPTGTGHGDRNRDTSSNPQRTITDLRLHTAAAAARLRPIHRRRPDPVRTLRSRIPQRPLTAPLTAGHVGNNQLRGENICSAINTVPSASNARRE
ncbi:hypothetical protein ABIA39_007606 [Nocardia sp. GAS34]